MPKKKPVSKKIKHKKFQFSPLTLLISVIILGVAGYLGYTVYEYNKSEQEKEGFFACNEDGSVCELSQHIHADIDLSACGEEIIFPKEAGRTDEQHTHKETNLMHWHARLVVDPETKQPIDPTRRKISAFLKQMNYEFPSSCETNKKPSLSVTVNGENELQGLDYVWQDGDKIGIQYD